MSEKIKTKGKERSSLWPKVRREYLKYHNTCAVCGGKKKLNVHHIKPFHIFPKDELNIKNLITLCEESGRECHLQFGHLGSYKSWNKNIISDATRWFKKRMNRP